MSEISKREVSRTIVEIYVPNPTLWSEIAKAMNLAKRTLVDLGIETSFDDAVQVRANEDEIVFWFEKPEVPS